MVAREHTGDVDYMIPVHIGLGTRTDKVVAAAQFMATSKYRVNFKGRGAHFTSALLEAASGSFNPHAKVTHNYGWTIDLCSEHG